jgi:hypothetical protein
MRAFGTVVAVLAALTWSGIVWGGYWLLAVAAETLALGAIPDWVPPEVWSLSNFAVGAMDDYGSGLAAGIWAIGILVILAVRAVYNWILDLAGRPAPSPTAVTPQPSTPPVEVPRHPEPAGSPQMRWGRGGG